MSKKIKTEGMDTYASKLKHLLKKRGMSITQLSEKTGIPYQTIYAAINLNRNTANLDRLQKVAAALDTNIYYFFKNAEEEFNLIRMYQNLSEEGRKNLIKILDENIKNSI